MGLNPELLLFLNSLKLNADQITVEIYACHVRVTKQVRAVIL